MIEVEVFFDCACVWAYLGLAHVSRLEGPGVRLRLRPVVADEVFDIVNPAARWPLSPVKDAYYQRDLAQWADYLELPLAADSPPQTDMRDCMLACVAAGRWDRAHDFARLALAATWADAADLADRAVLATLWAQGGLPASVFAECLAWPGVAEELAANTRELMERGGFGVPTFFIGDDLYFGNDSIPLVERAAGLAP
jgi:2-hydroxychromene-2-carboxylate isomerase